MLGQSERGGRARRLDGDVIFMSFVIINNVLSFIIKLIIVQFVYSVWEPLFAQGADHGDRSQTVLDKQCIIARIRIIKLCKLFS